MIKCTCCNCGRPRFDSNHPPLQFQGIWPSLLGSMSTSYIHGAHTSDKTHIKIKKMLPGDRMLLFLYTESSQTILWWGHILNSLLFTVTLRGSGQFTTVGNIIKVSSSMEVASRRGQVRNVWGSGWIPLTMLPQRAFYFSQYSTIMTLSWDGLEMSYSTVCWMSCHCQGLENFDHRVRFPCRHKGIEEHDAKVNHSSQSPGREKCCMPSSLASHGIQTPLYYMARYAPKLPL